MTGARDGMGATRPRTRPAILAYAAAVCAVGAVVAGAVTACSDTGGAPFRTVDDGDAARGKRAIGTYGCGACHVIPGIAAAQGTVGPPLTAFGRRTYIAGRLPNTAGNLARWIAWPQRVDPGNAMPNLGVTERDARDITAYLYTLH